MTICVHLTVEKNLPHIERNGIKAVAGATGVKGIYCMPVLQDYYVSHQWLRELKRGHGRGRTPLAAVDFKVPSTEIILVGHFSQPHQKMTIAEASKLIMTVDDPLGFEMFLPRSVKKDEIHRIRSVSQVIGWRYFPAAKGKTPCACDFCIRGQFGASKLRARLGDDDSGRISKQQALNVLREGKDEQAMVDVLYSSFGGKRRKNPDELEFLLAHPSAKILSGLAFALQFYSGEKALAMLEELSQNADANVRQQAIVSRDSL